jgi:hypothetical protein
MVVVDMCFVCLLHPRTPLCGGSDWAWTSVITTMFGCMLMETGAGLLLSKKKLIHTIR